MSFRVPYIAAALALLAGCTADPAPRFRVASVSPQRLPDGRVETTVRIENNEGPQQTALCVRLEWLSQENPTRLIEAREQCTSNKLAGNSATELRFAMKRTRRTVGDSLVATLSYRNGHFFDPGVVRSAEVPQ
jgi:hypothetical protein